MQTSNKNQFFSGTFSFALIAAAWGVFYILFGEKLPAHGGLGWDGQNYAHIAHHWLDSRALDSYTATRFLPSGIIHVIFTAFNVPFTNETIINGFLVLNMLSMVVTIYLLKRIFDMLRIPLSHQYLGMILFFFSYGISRFLLYYAIMTDSFSVMLSTLLLFAYLSRNTLLLCIASIASAFTWPIIFYVSLFLLIFPFKGLRRETKEISLTNPIRAISSLIILLLGVYFLYVQKAENEIIYSMRIHHGLLPLSLLSLVALYYFLPSVLPFKKGWFKEMVADSKILNIMIFVVLAGVMIFITKKMNPNNIQSGYMAPEYLVKTPIVLAVIRPVMFLVSHFAFFGFSALMISFYWKEVSRAIRSMGWGIVLAVCVSLFWLAGTIESRSLFHLFPWMIVFLVLGMREKIITNRYLILVFVLAFVASKIYMHIGYQETTGYNDDGTVAFPNQKFLMNQGPWMAPGMYLLHLIVMLIMCAILYFLKSTYHSTRNEKKLYPEPTGSGI